MGDIFIRLALFPTIKVYGLVEKDDKGDYNIYIDERLTYKRKIQTIIHELSHIVCGHFEDSKKVIQAEFEASFLSRAIIMFSGGKYAKIKIQKTR